MFKILKPFIFLLLLLLLSAAIYVILDVFISLKIKEIIDTAIGTEVIDNFKKPTLYFLILLLLYFPGLLLNNYLRNRFIWKCMGGLRKKYVQRVFKKNINEFQKENNATYMSALTNDFNQIEKNYLEPLTDLIAAIANFIAGIFLITVVSPLVLLIIAVIMIINLTVSILAAKPLNRHNKERSAMFSDYTVYIKEILSAFHIIKTNDLDDRVRRNFQVKSEQIQNKGYLIDKIISYVSAIQQANFSFTFLGLYIAVVYLDIKGIISFGGVILIINSIDKLIWPVYAASEAFPKMFSVKSLYDKIEKSLLNQNEYTETLDYSGLNQEITLRNVKFSYEDNVILDNVSLQFKKGGKYLIVGPSGGGKSTLLRLLRKYFNPQSGEILIDNVPLKDIQKDQYFANIANIEQNIFVFEDTVRNNLTLYKNYTENEITNALKQAGLTDFIRGLPQGLDTVIYDNGKNISGGERSRIAIARGLLNKADILLLDEPFAHLDSETAKEIEKSILDLPNVTVINVSHIVFKENKDGYNQCFLVKNKQVIAV
ncbi:MAG: ABC transporter ATP-binding protein/permease [Bacilli bacterium]|nr:ABC transporter ATP-binding protein/permease [Bacilli bacterium]